jgi:hypothetical protein
MSSESLNFTDSQYFVLGWFRFPVEQEDNITVIEILGEIFKITPILPNIMLLWAIWKYQDKKPRSDKDLLLANLAIVNILTALFGVAILIEQSTGISNVITYKVQAIVLSILLPKYYSCMFLLTLTQYVLIVKPLKFKLIDPRKIKTTKIFLVLHWIVVTAVLIITPIFYGDFDKYIKVMVMIIVCFSWKITLWMGYMYTRILHRLWKRNNDLQKKFNASETRQGTIALRQNNRLARALLFFIVTLVLFSLPSNTAYLFFLYCPQCSQRVIVKVCLYTLPLVLALITVHPIHWIIATPSYYKELKRQAVKIFVFCRPKETE